MCWPGALNQFSAYDPSGCGPTHLQRCNAQLEKHHPSTYLIDLPSAPHR